MRKQGIAGILFLFVLLTAGIVGAQTAEWEGESESLLSPLPTVDSERTAHRVVTLAPGGPLLESPILSRVEYYRAVQSIAAGRYDIAREHLFNAVEGDPSLVRGHLLLSLLHLRSLDPKWILFLVDAGKALQGNFRGQSLLVANAVIGGFTLLILLLALLSGAALLRSLPFLRHTIMELLPDNLPRPLLLFYPFALGGALVAFFRPWSWGMGLFWLVATGVLLARRGFDRWERFVTAAFLALLITAPVAVKTAIHFTLPSMPGTTLFALSGTPLFPLEGDEGSLPLEDDGDGDILFSLALLERERGDLNRSMELYREMLDRGFGSVSVYNNMGNLLFLRGETDLAFSAYRKALDLDPERATSHYNLGQLYLEAFAFDRAREEFSKASEFNFSLIRSLSRLSRHTDRLTLIDESLPPSHLWGRFLGGRAGEQGMDWAEALGATRRILFPFPAHHAVPLALLIGFAGWFGSTRRAPLVCVRCGRILCRRCRVRETGHDFCAECSGGGTERSWGRNTVLFHRPMALALSVLFPGAGHVYLGRRRIGVFYLVLALSILILWAFRGPVLKPFPILHGGDLIPLENLIFGWVFLPVYLFVLIDALLLVRKHFRNGTLGGMI
ncbi:MAG: tetratricopeptide repeat protein [Candidatus Eisenbacteria bacterium]|nr:tetratricopeptide repeat protein [Candidatus Eisenbacteria bacterium]